MAKPLRIEFDRTSYHVTSRGNAREPIFILIQIVSCFLIKESASIARIKTRPLWLLLFIINNMEENGFEYIKLDEYEGNPIIGRVVFFENGIKEKEI